MRPASWTELHGPCPQHRGPEDAFLCTTPGLSRTWGDSPIAPFFPKLLGVWWPGEAPTVIILGQLFLTPADVFFPSWNTLECSIFVVKMLAESKSGDFHVPLYWGWGVGEMYPLAEMRQMPHLGKGDPWQRPPCSVAGDIFSGFLSLRRSRNRARVIDTQHLPEAREPWHVPLVFRLLDVVPGSFQASTSQHFLQGPGPCWPPARAPS